MCVCKHALLLLTAFITVPFTHGKSKKHTTVDLVTSSFDAKLSSLPRGTKVLAEFYAGWCPHCRYYAHTYEQIARFFAAQEHLGVLVVRVDCAVERMLCADFRISSYPTLTFGPAEQYVARGNVTRHPSRDDRGAVSMVAWVGQQMGRSFNYQDIPEQQTALTGHEWLQSLGQWKHDFLTDHAKGINKLWTLADVELATVELWEQIMGSPPLHSGPEKRGALLALLRWWSAAHPSGRCKAGAQKLAALLDVMWWPQGKESAPQELRAFQICGPRDRLNETSWQACKGSLPDSRGFTCGLWLLFHASSARMPDMGGHILAEGLRAFGHHFFLCNVCQKHFVKVIASPGSLDEVKTREDGMLWLWKTHNEVNAWLAAHEKTAGSISAGDPMFPKIQFPSAAMCPSCRKHASSAASNGSMDMEWDTHEVLTFLDREYGDDGSDDDPGHDGSNDGPGHGQPSVGSSVLQSRPEEEKGKVGVSQSHEEDVVAEAQGKVVKSQSPQGGSAEVKGVQMVENPGQQAGPEAQGANLMESQSQQREVGEVRGQGAESQSQQGAAGKETGGQGGMQGQQSGPMEQRKEMVESQSQQGMPTQEKGLDRRIGGEARPNDARTGTGTQGVQESGDKRSSGNGGSGGSGGSSGGRDGRGSEEVQLDLGRRGNAGASNTTGPQEGIEAHVVGGDGTKGATGATGGTDKPAQEGGAVQELADSDKLSQDVNSNRWVVLVWACCVLGVACVACFLLHYPRRRGVSTLEALGSGRQGQQPGGKGGGKDGITLVYSTSNGGGVGSSNGCSARMRNGSGALGMGRGVVPSAASRMVEEGERQG